ncbi:centaurin 5 [Schizosaccharomyces japonicus yFS275]|uniref:ADP-ribosylation factor GTPase-activating protein n=1 Tax=Schizosaccharomyces japonicus (strain yFS275 / FY16936) TaxID=402676 RepID=B6JVQ2_SCHJY|nr:centaurin 5 [Schizosaccharomyces japonicus yFS275]EEB05453.2 centaurin 5 [Schizosaccharomyces japonicus yFS275]
MPYEQTQTDTSAVPSDAILSPIHYPSVREMDQAEPQDGPLFRATMLNFERTANETRSALKKVIKRSEDYAQTSGLMYVSNNEFSQVLSKAANVNPPAFGPFVDHYHRESSRLLSSFYLDRAQLVRSKLVEPLRKIYENDIKTTDSKKKDFEERSRDFYASLSRYLSKNKEADKVKDSKFSAKKREFELTRFDYYSYMQDINGGRKGQEILSVLTNFATQDYALINQLLSDIKNLRPNLDVLRETVTEADKEFQLIRAGREERRRTLETSTLESEDLDAELAAQAYSVQLEKSSAAKQGLLLALSKTSSDIQVVPKTNWHKYWVVLDHGRICEYSNWKQSLELHTEPINLLMASVREAKNVGRRFCFEVITPQLRRVYQATSQTELVSWLEAIQAAIAESIALKGKKQHGDSSIISNTNHRNLSSASSNGGNALHRRASSLSPGQRHTRSESVEVKVSKPSLVSVLKTLHPSDEYCADCGSRTKVEWCSINFPVVLCIDCSGIHRSLGTHISKVRSLTLDKLSHETVELLRNTGNALVNDIYEANLPSSAQKQAMLDSPLSRASFIKDKYTKRAYVQSVPGDALETLLEAIKANNIRDIIWCLASIEGVIPTIAMETALKQDALMIAELLGHNGVALPTDEAFLASCSVKARQYIAYRTGKQVVIPASTTTAPKVTRHSTSTSHSELPTGGRATD